MARKPAKSEACKTRAKFEECSHAGALAHRALSGRIEPALTSVLDHAHSARPATRPRDCQLRYTRVLRRPTSACSFDRCSFWWAQMAPNL